MTRKPGEFHDYSRLMNPNSNGQFWFGSPGAYQTATIYPFRGDKESTKRGQFWVALPNGEALFEGPKLKAFDTALDALDAIRNWIEVDNIRQERVVAALNEKNCKKGGGVK